MSLLQEVYYHVKESGLTSGTVLPKGSYGLYLAAQGLSATNDPIQEHLRETIRLASYSNMPSRFFSSFVFETLSDAKVFRDNWRQGMSIYQVRFLKTPTAIHRVCYTAWDVNFPNQVLQAHQFWKDPPLYRSDTEVFAEEDIVII